MVHVFTSVKEGHTMGLEKVSVNCASLYTTNYLNTLTRVSQCTCDASIGSHKPVSLHDVILFKNVLLLSM